MFRGALVLVLLLAGGVDGARRVGIALPRGPQLTYFAQCGESRAPNIHIVDVVRGFDACLTFDDQFKRAPAWSADGEWLAYYGNTSGAETSLNLLHMATGGRRTLYTGERVRATEAPAWSPDGTMLAFSAYSENNAVDIFVVHVATGDITPLTTTVYNDIQPNWSPDGTELAFASERWGLPITVYSMVPDDPANEPQVIGEGVQPVWSPDGARIAYYAFVGGALRLAIAEPGVVTHYLEMPGLINAPLTWSPDASTLIVQADQGNGFDLYTVDVADGQIQPLAATPTYEGNAAWSPDSEWIAYVAGINTLDTVWVAQPDGRDARQVSQAQTRSWYPAWRPQ